MDPRDVVAEVAGVDVVERMLVAVEFRTHAARMRRQQQDPVADDERFLDRMRDEQQRETEFVPGAAVPPASCGASTRRARRTARPSAARAAASPVRARSRRAASCRPTACADRRRRTRSTRPCRDNAARAPGFGARQPCGGTQRKRDVFDDRLPRRQLVELLEHHDAVSRPAHRPTVERDRTRYEPMKPAIAFSSVDFPHPDGPSSTKRSLPYVEADLGRAHDPRAAAVFEVHPVDGEQAFTVRAGLRGIRRGPAGDLRVGHGWTAGAAPPRAAYGGSQVRGEVAFTIESLAGKASACGQTFRGPTIDCPYRNRTDA